MTDSISPGSYRFPPVGRCIYCGSDRYVPAGGRLAAEHIIPLSLGGNMILPEASCKACEKVTHSFEYTVARTIFGNFRIRNKLPTRRRKERPKVLPLAVSSSHGGGSKDIDPSEHPAPVLVYVFPEPSIIYGIPPNRGIYRYRPIIIADKNNIGRAVEEHGWDRLVHDHGQVMPFVRMLAKIGHAFAVANCGLNAFEPLATDLIMGRSTDFPYIVGTAPTSPALDPERQLAAEAIMAYRFDPMPALVMVKVHLLPYSEFPQYVVIVGQTYSPEKIALLQEKASDRSVISRLVDFS